MISKLSFLSISISLLYLCDHVCSDLPRNVIDSLMKIDDFKNEMDTYGAGACGRQCWSAKPDSKIELLIVMDSKPEQVEERHAVRTTWGTQWNLTSAELRIVFLVRIAETDDNMDSVIRENNDHRDIVRTVVLPGDKMMARAMSSLVWLYNQCQRAGFVLRIEETVMVNIPAVLDFIRSQPKATETVWGNVLQKTIFLTKDKQSVEKIKLTVCERWGYLMTSDMVRKLIILNHNRDYYYNSELKHEAEYITGSQNGNQSITKIHDIRFKPISQDNTLNFIYFTRGPEIE